MTSLDGTLAILAEEVAAERRRARRGTSRWRVAAGVSVTAFAVAAGGLELDWTGRKPAADRKAEAVRSVLQDPAALHTLGVCAAELYAQTTIARHSPPGRSAGGAIAGLQAHDFAAGAEVAANHVVPCVASRSVHTVHIEEGVYHIAASDLTVIDIPVQCDRNQALGRLLATEAEVHGRHTEAYTAWDLERRSAEVALAAAGVTCDTAALPR